jgi:hypothetical protein
MTNGWGSEDSGEVFSLFFLDKENLRLSMTDGWGSVENL